MKGGWALPSGINGGAARKWHYFVNGRSLCLRWGLLRGEPETGLDDSVDNCAECKRRLAAWKSEGEALRGQLTNALAKR